jgi:hypothetical protein
MEVSVLDIKEIDEVCKDFKRRICELISPEMNDSMDFLREIFIRFVEEKHSQIDLSVNIQKLTGVFEGIVRGMMDEKRRSDLSD